MISITLVCTCGQKFVFDVEPVEGRMPSMVACPTCGLDATELGNEEIQRQLTLSQPAAPSEKREILMIIGAGVAALALLGLAGGGYLWWQSRTEKPAVAQVAAPAAPTQKDSSPAPAETPPTPTAPTLTAAQVAPSNSMEPSAPVARTAPVAAVTPAKGTRDPSFVAVGAFFDRDLKTRHVEITRVLAKSPAKKAGIVVGDVLISIDGTPIQELRLKEIADMVYGPVGSKITMELLRAKNGKTKRVEMVRTRHGS